MTTEECKSLATAAEHMYKRHRRIAQQAAARAKDGMQCEGFNKNMDLAIAFIRARNAIQEYAKRLPQKLLQSSGQNPFTQEETSK